MGRFGRAIPLAAVANFSLSYTTEPRLACSMRRNPDRAELEFAFLFFLLIVPVGYWILQGAFALLGIG